MMHIQDGRLVIVGAQRVQVRSSRSRVRITLQELFLIWLGGRITSPRVWFGAGGQGVTLKLAWGPSNSSPWNLRFVFVVFFIFPLFIIILCLPFFLVFLSSHIFGSLWYFPVMVLVRLGCFFLFFIWNFSVYVTIIIIIIWRTIGFNEYYSFHWNYRSQQKWCKLQPKRSAGKKEGEVQNMVPTSNHVSAGRRDLGDFDQGRFRKPALFRRGLRLLRLKADTSRIKTCW